MRLTPTQRRALARLASGELVSPGALGQHLGTSREGAAATASSLVRRHLAVRERNSGHVAYRITALGLEYVRHDQLALEVDAP